MVHAYQKRCRTNRDLAKPSLTLAYLLLVHGVTVAEQTSIGKDRLMKLTDEQVGNLSGAEEVDLRTYREEAQTMLLNTTTTLGNCRPEAIHASSHAHAEFRGAMEQVCHSVRNSHLRR